METLTKELMEQREQSDACIDSAESRQKKAEDQLMERQKKAEGQQMEQQKQQLKDEQKKAEGQLVEEGAWPLDDDDLDQAAGGSPIFPGPPPPTVQSNV